MDDGQIVVIGSGTMGVGIAQSFLAAGLRVVLVDRAPAALNEAASRIGNGLARQWRDSPEVDAGIASAFDRLELTADVPKCDDANLVIEAVPEDRALKHVVLRDVEARCGESTVIATNTSSLSINELATALTDPTRFLGMHYFNPVPQSTLIELVSGKATSEQTLAHARGWAELLGKTTIVVSDSPGFATSRLGLALGLEAIRMLEERVASAEDIDKGMVLGYKHPVGPLRLTDIVGLDVRLGIAEHLCATLGSRFEPPSLLRQMVAQGKLGKKVGEGFYEWE
jgi:3-hydroxybutyryl-CoA dehydrogenase